MRLVLLLFTAGRASADGFHAGDAWRGTMTNCQQSPHMLRRAMRYIAIELSVLAVDDRKMEDVYPPESGWRPVDAARGPPPAIRTSVRSLYAALPEHHRLQAGAAAKAEDARAHSVAILGACGLMLWALVYTLSTKVRLSPRGVNAVKKFFPSPRQAWLPRRGSFSLE